MMMSQSFAKRAGAAPQPTEPVTSTEVDALGDIGPTELVKGEIVQGTPAKYSHGFIESAIVAHLFNYLHGHKIGRVISGGVGVYTQRIPDTIRAIDIAFISNERYQQVQSNRFLDVAPELVVEILSPTNSQSKIHEKLAEYFAIAVQNVWIVDPQMAQVHVYHSMDDMTVLTQEDTLTGGDILPGFTLALADIFENV